jgi:Nitroreductase
MNKVLENINTRRSVRAYKDEPVSDDLVKTVLDAGFRAACGMNAQAVRFAVVSNKDKINEYSKKGKELYLKAIKEMGFSNEKIESILADPDYHIFHRAPVVIFVFTAPDALTAAEDAALAVGNMMLASHSLGLGTCWIGFAGALDQDPNFVNEMNCKDLKYHAAVVLGYPLKEGKPTPRGETPIICWTK